MFRSFGKTIAGLAFGVAAAVASTSASATVVGFAANPTANSVDFNNFVASHGGTINSNVNFDTHPTGGLISNFYTVSDGVTLISTDYSTSVQYGAGPGNGNSGSTPKSSGEGTHPVSNYLYDGTAASTLTINFAQAVLAAGLYVIDNFSPDPYNEVPVIAAYTGLNGTGTLLGSFSAPLYNYQNNFQYFLGIASTLGDIRSLVITDPNGGTGDTIGYDDLRFAVAPTTAVPEPASLALLGLGLGGLALSRRKSRQG